MALRLIIEDFDGSTTIVPLEEQAVTIGRKEGNTIQLNEKNVSRSHAQLMLADDGWVVEDLGSYNGVHVNGVVISERVPLREGDVITIGDYSLLLHDDVGRKTIDLERPIRAANQEHPEFKEAATEPPVVGASSSQDLPRLTAAELEQMSTDNLPPMSVAEMEDDLDQGSSKRGVVIGVVVVALLTLGAGGWWMMNQPGEAANDVSGEPSTEPAANDAGGAGGESVADDAADDEAPDGAATAETSGAAVAAETGDDDAIIEQEPDGDGGLAETSPEEVLEDEPEPQQKPRRKKAAPAETAPADADPDALLADARKASMSGDLNKAYKLAKQSYAAKRTDDALKVMAVSACKMGSKTKAKSAYTKMKSGKDAVKQLCASHGIQL